MVADGFTARPAVPGDALAEAGAPLACWKVLDADFGDGAPFLAAWARWLAAPSGPRLLHYVVVLPQAPALAGLLRQMAANPGLRPFQDVLARQCFGLHGGFHRIVLHGGRLQLTLCIGALEAMLREMQFTADHIRLPDASLLEDRWQSKVLLRLCRPGTLVRAGPLPLPTAAAAALRRLGLEYVEDQRDGVLLRHAPPWNPPATRHRWRQPPRTPSRCIVVGAGLAGAAVAAALALRGWQVDVMDAAPLPAAGASGLPAGLMAAPVSRDDAPRSRLARAGIRLTREACQRWLQAGQQWAPCGVLELPESGYDDTPAPLLPEAWTPEALEWSRAAADGAVSRQAQALAAEGALWHGHGSWVRPAALVQALLERPGVRFRGRCAVAALRHDGHEWQVLGGEGQVHGQAPVVVLCAAHRSTALAANAVASEGQPLLRLAPMQSVGGTLSWGLHAEGDDVAFPPFAVQGSGHFCGHVPFGSGQSWWTGATFTPRSTEAAPNDAALQAAHAFNLRRLRQLLPDVAARLQARFDGADVQAWSGLRCATVDRLPASGPLDSGAQPSLWTSTGMGARGLSYALLCAELLVAELGAEPLPVEASLARALRAERPRLQSD